MADDATAGDFGELAERFTAAVRRGEAPSVEGWAARHPEHAAEIRELFPAILAMEELKSGAPPPRRVLGPNDRLGDFRIVREIGRGGMGVVYEAVQESLGRRVAVKVLPSLGDVRRVRRFEREARTAARLHHTNIVPIFGVGSEGDWHYYVMQVIRGVGLDAVLARLRDESEGRASQSDARLSDASITSAVRALRTGVFQAVPGPTPTTDPDSAPSGDRLPSDASDAPASEQLPPDPGPPLDPRARYWRSVAALGRQVAAALGHAHGQGVLHRDVKPANLLLDGHGVVWVTDFGLASAAHEAEGLTRSGDLLGTLQYMAPEQLKGVYDERTDLYALGLTLYELLTLRPAFRESDRGHLLERIARGVDQPPSRVRSGIPDDLETVVLKALAPDPRHRYATAAELADDLQRFLDDRPIRARRATALEHGWRWCRRNKALAVSGLLAVGGVIATGVVGWIGYASTRSALDREARAARDARDSAAEAEDNLALAVEVLEQIRESIAGPPRLRLVETSTEEGGEAGYSWEASGTTISERDARLLEQLLGFHERIARRHADDAELRVDAARAWRRVADVQLRLGRGAEAVDGYRRALELFGEDVDPRTAAAIRTDLAAALVEQGERLAALGELDDVVASLDDETSEAGRYELARAHELLGTLRVAQLGGRGPRAGALPPPVDPDRPPRMAGRARPRDPLGPTEGSDARGGRRRRFEMLRARAAEFVRQAGLAGVGDFELALELFTALVEDHPDNPEYRVAAARSAREYARTLVVAGERDRAVRSRIRELTAQSVAQLTDLVQRHPGVADYRAELIESRLVVPPPERGERDGPSWDALEAAAAAGEALVDEHPSEIRYRRVLARVYAQQAWFERLVVRAPRRVPEGPRPAALDPSTAARIVGLYDRALQQIEGAESPADTQARIEFRLGQLDALRASRQFEAVRRLLAEVRDEVESAALGLPAARRIGGELRRGYGWLARELRLQGDDAAARAAEADGASIPRRR